MEWLKIEIATSQEMEEIVTAVFLEAGATGVNIEGEVDIELGPDDYLGDEPLAEGPFRMSAYFACDGTEQEVLQTIRTKLDELQKIEIAQAETFDVSTQIVHEQDWAHAWKKHFKPIKVSQNIVIKPSWEEYSPLQDELIIELDPGMAFGTGTHESTRMCLQLLEEFLIPDNTVIDVGTGSGILSIAAAGLGAKEVYATDYDSVALEVAQENIQKNSYAKNIKLLQSDLLKQVEKGIKADLMVANIIADVVIDLSYTVRDHLKKNAIFICSGIIDSKEAEVRQALVTNGLKLINIKSDGEWRVIVCKYRG